MRPLKLITCLAINIIFAACLTGLSYAETPSLSDEGVSQSATDQTTVEIKNFNDDMDTPKADTVETLEETPYMPEGDKAEDFDRDGNGIADAEEFDTIPRQDAEIDPVKR